VSGRNFLIINILILVLNIVPASAVQISEYNNTNSSTSQNNTESLISSINSETKDLQTSSDEIDKHNGVINDSLSYIKSNWWKFWKWGNIVNKINEINSETQKITNLTSVLNTTAVKIQKDSEKLEKNFNQDNINGNPNDIKDARQMINKLQERLNVNISIGNNTNMSQGDIIQYKSQDKYYHYLKYVKTENNNIILEGSKNKLITISQNEFNNKTILKLITKTPSNNSKIINEAYKIQKSEITNQINDQQSKKRSYNALAISGTVISGLGTVLVIAGITVFGLAIALICFIPTTAPAGMDAGIKITVVGFALMVLGGPLLIIGLALMSKADNDLKKLNDILDDLKMYDDACNHVPIAENMNLTTNGTALNGTLNASDIDEDSLKFTIVNEPLHGNLKLEADGNFTYTANNESNGTDSFTYFANDGQLNSNTATVTLNTHTPPMANNMSITTRMGKNTTLMFNSTDIYGLKVNCIVLSNPMHGTINYTDEGIFTYTPFSNYTGIDNFTYIVNDGYFNSNVGVVNIVVNSDIPPVANNMTVSTIKNMKVSKTFNIIDMDGDKLTIIIITKPTHGSVTLSSDGKFVYTPYKNFVGTDFFIYMGNDGFFNSNTAKVLITVKK